MRSTGVAAAGRWAASRRSGQAHRGTPKFVDVQGEEALDAQGDGVWLIAALQIVWLREDGRLVVLDALVAD